MVVKKRTALAEQRLSAGHTQESLAEAMAVERSTVGRWEAGRTEPRPWQRAKLAAELKVDARELERLLQQTRRDATAEAAPALRAQESEAPIPEPTSDIGADALRLDSVDGLVEDWVAANSASVQSKIPLLVTKDEVAVAEGVLAMFRQLDHTHGARRYAGQVSGYIDEELAALLHRPVASDEVARQRAMLTASFCELAGYQAVDVGNPARAQTYYQRALTLTAATNDRAYGAYLVAVNLGHLALHCGQPEIALRWAMSADAAAGTAASPVTRAAITAVVARANARMHRGSEAIRLIRQAEKLIDAADFEDEPGWIRYFTHAYLADEVAHCFQDLGHAPDARDQLADALDGVGKDKVRRRAIDVALLASTWLRTGDVDEACASGRDAVAFAARTGSGRCVERVAGLLVDLQAHADYAPARDLREFARSVLPESDSMAITLVGGA